MRCTPLAEPETVATGAGSMAAGPGLHAKKRDSAFFSCIFAASCNSSFVRRFNRVVPSCCRATFRIAMPLFAHCCRNASLVRSGLRAICVIPLLVSPEEELGSLVCIVPLAGACEEELASLVVNTVSNAVPCRFSHFVAHSAATSLMGLHVRYLRPSGGVTSLRVGTSNRFASSIRVLFRMDAKSGAGIPPSNGYCQSRTVRSQWEVFRELRSKRLSQNGYGAFCITKLFGDSCEESS